jgi:hypothetical protein
MDRFRITILGTLFAALTGFSVVPKFAVERPEHRWHIQRDSRDIREDRRDLHADHKDMRSDLKSLDKDYETLRQDQMTLRNDLKNGASADQIAKDRQAVESMTDTRVIKRMFSRIVETS